MNMIEAVQSCLKKYVGFSGRARRSEYWYWVLATIIIAVILAIVEGVLGLSNAGDGPLSNIFNLAIFLPGLAVSFRRLHDTGRSCLLYTSPSPRDKRQSRMPSSA